MRQLVRVFAYIIIQVLTDNVLEHAQANTLNLQMEGRAGGLVITIEDDGVGFDPTGQAVYGIGLINVRARVKNLRGSITLDSALGRGTSITIQIPPI